MATLFEFPPGLGTPGAASFWKRRAWFLTTLLLAGMSGPQMPNSIKQLMLSAGYEDLESAGAVLGAMSLVTTGGSKQNSWRCEVTLAIFRIIVVPALITAAA